MPYIDAYELPKNEEQFVKHKVVLHASGLTSELYGNWFGHVPQAGFVA